MLKFIKKFLLALTFISSFLILLLATTLKFQLLDSNFWIDTFNNSEVYPKLEKLVLQEVVKKVSGGEDEVLENRLLGSIITAENLQDFSQRNIKNFLDFTNGKTAELKIYIPVKKLPKGILPSTLSMNEEPSAQTLASLFGRKIPEQSLKQLASVGTWSFISWLLSLLSIIFLFWVSYKMVEEKKRLTFPSFILIASSILTFIVIGVLSMMKVNMARDLVTSDKPAEVLLGTLAPPLLTEILMLWTKMGLFGLGLGVILLFFKKKSFR